MLDIRFIRENAELVAEKAKQKGFDVNISKLLEVDKKWKSILEDLEAARSFRNEFAKQKGKTDVELRAEAKKLRGKIKGLEARLKSVEEERFKLLKAVPNMPADDVPIGTTEADSVVTKEWGEKSRFDFEPKNHWEIAETRGLIDKERAAKVAGSRFAYVMGDLVKLQFALIQFALEVLTNEETLKKIIQEFEIKNVSSKPFVPVLPPAMARTDVYEATGRLNREEQTYKIEDGDLWLNASAEHTLAPMFMREILNEKDMPLRYVGYTTAFRREAGTYGKDMEGVLRLHQFDKLEMESFTLPEDGMNEHLFMIAIQEYLMQQLKLPYHVLNKCTADIGFPNARGVDIEVWLPGQNKYRETHTADFISDFQAEGTQTRVKTTNGIVYVYNNDATAFAMGRTLIAIIENYQTAGGKVGIPTVLRPYMGGQLAI
ncbi:serine--tRNA ligase [Candidatus Saccharibacteria bacterium]|nr:serine--tRNA ligase [Candidatus Saccharibacteria bacterium]